MKRATRFLIGLALLPVCAAVARTLWALLMNLPGPSGTLLPVQALSLGAGLVLWVFLYFTMPRPMRTYVLAHELTHALWGMLFGARVLRMQVRADSGAVTLTKTNFLVALAPYFFPLYTMIVVVAYGVLTLFRDPGPYELYWLALVGFTWGFHLTFTVSSLMQQQSDIRDNGRLFSWAVIFLMNALGICLWVVLVSLSLIHI